MSTSRLAYTFTFKVYTDDCVSVTSSISNRTYFF